MVKNNQLIKSKKIAIRLVVALGLAKMVEGENMKPQGSEIMKFNSTSIDPEGVFEVLAYYIISKRLGASTKKKKLIIAKKEEIDETLAEAFVLGLRDLPEIQWLSLQK